MLCSSRERGKGRDAGVLTDRRLGLISTTAGCICPGVIFNVYDVYVCIIPYICYLVAPAAICILQACTLNTLVCVFQVAEVIKDNFRKGGAIYTPEGKQACNIVRKRRG